MNNQDIIIFCEFILIFVVIYLIFKTNTKEHFDVNDDIKQAINDIYKADINAIRNLSNFATEIKNNNDTFTIPANKLTIPGYIDIVQLRGAVIAWALPTIPKGWAICDGQKYKLDSSYNAVVDSDGIQTPDLRGRFVLGSGVGGKDMNNLELSNRTLGSTGGEEKHVLINNEMPGHTHRINWGELGCNGTNCWAAGKKVGTSVFTSNLVNPGNYAPYTNPGNFPQNTGNTGGVLRARTGNKIDGADVDYNVPPVWDAVAHENMPPFYVLTYIMKL